MKNTNLKIIVELVGVAAIVASLTFVGIELRQSQEIAKAEIGMAALATNIEIRNYISDNADIWRRGNEGEDLNDTDKIVFDLIVEKEASYAWWSYTSFSRISAGGVRAETPIHNFAKFLQLHPAAMNSWEERRIRESPYSVFYGVPLESESFTSRVFEVLERYESL